jgi:hypothetical protein
MKICGFTIIRNAIVNDYPVVEAITSILPVVDEMIVSVGKSDDDTEGLIRSIDSPKMKIVHSEWDMNLRQGGRVLAVETNKAFAQIPAEFDWAFYIQADEVVHEKYHVAIRAAAEKYCTDKHVEGLLFNYKHFYGTYDYVGDSRKWYPKEVRIIRNNKDIKSYLDAQSFRKFEKEKLWVKQIDAVVYHYGWVKTPAQMQLKNENFGYWWNESPALKTKATEAVFDYAQFDSLEKFTGTHPAVMQKRIAAHPINFEFDVTQKRMSFTDRMLMKYEKLTGVRPFSFRSYRILK